MLLGGSHAEGCSPASSLGGLCECLLTVTRHAEGLEGGEAVVVGSVEVVDFEVAGGGVVVSALLAAMAVPVEDLAADAAPVGRQW